MPADLIHDLVFREHVKRITAATGCDEQTAKAILLGAKIALQIIAKAQAWDDHRTALAIQQVQKDTTAELVRVQSLSNTIDPTRRLRISGL